VDSITHIALGACIGDAFFERGFGKKAMWWGMLAQSVPDIDFLASFWSDTSQNLLIHRGFTHSILFGVLIVPVLVLIAERVHRPHNISYRKWALFFFAEVFTHLLIDAFNNYGVGWFEPFSHLRFSFNAVYVVDPFFSFWPGISAMMLIILSKDYHRRRLWRALGLGIPAIYLFYCLMNKYAINQRVQENFSNQSISHERYFSTPAPLQSWLWFVVAGNDEGYNVGYCSVFDRDKKIKFEYFPRNDSLLTPIKDREDVLRLIKFSQQFYTVEKYHDTLVFNDLRFGQITGWQNPRNRFAFHYFLDYPKANDLVVQRGRFTGWNKQSLLSFYQRIEGH